MPFDFAPEYDQHTGYHEERARQRRARTFNAGMLGWAMENDVERWCQTAGLTFRRAPFMQSRPDLLVKADTKARKLFDDNGNDGAISVDIKAAALRPTPGHHGHAGGCVSVKPYQDAIVIGIIPPRTKTTELVYFNLAGNGFKLSETKTLFITRDRNGVRLRVPYYLQNYKGEVFMTGKMLAKLS